jgi:hypothetical protein
VKGTPNAKAVEERHQPAVLGTAVVVAHGQRLVLPSRETAIYLFQMLTLLSLSRGWRYNLGCIVLTDIRQASAL